MIQPNLLLTLATTHTSRSLHLCMYCYFQRDMFVLKEIQPVMELDSLNASHPLSLKESEVETTSDILGLFDSITYNKAGWSLFTALKFEGSCI